MLPSNLVGLALFVTLLFPGYVYDRRRELDLPERQRSTFRETTSIVFVSVVLDFVVVVGLIVIGQLLPDFGDDFHQFAKNQSKFGADHPILVVIWLSIFLATSSLLAYAAGSRAPVIASVLRRNRGDGPANVHRGNLQQSAWWLLFQNRPTSNSKIYVSCHLEDGSLISGVLNSYSRSSNESGDRDLTLTGDIYYRHPQAAEGAVLEQTSAAVISARRLKLMTVSYVDPSAAQPPSPIILAQHAPSSSPVS